MDKFPEINNSDVSEILQPETKFTKSIVDAILSMGGYEMLNAVSFRFALFAFIDSLGIKNLNNCTNDQYFALINRTHLSIFSPKQYLNYDYSLFLSNNLTKKCKFKISEKYVVYILSHWVRHKLTKPFLHLGISPKDASDSFISCGIDRMRIYMSSPYNSISSLNSFLFSILTRVENELNPLPEQRVDLYSISCSRIIDSFVNKCKHANLDTTPDNIANNLVRLSNNEANYICIITGGPGTGKTTLINKIVLKFKEAKISHKVASFTGKAVARINESWSDINANTLDILITNGDTQCEHLIIDESSMLTTELLAKFIVAHGGSNLKITLIGDVDQLPPVKGGCIFNNLMSDPKITKYKLETNYRLENKGYVLENVIEDVKNGKFERYENDCSFEFVENGNINDTIDKSKEYETSIILTFKNDDVDAINGILAKSKRIAEGDKIIVTKNVRILDESGSKKLYANGISGDVVKSTEKYATVKFGDHEKKLPKTILKHSYAITIHKSQGSEFENVIIYVNSKSNIDKKLLYTAITRAKRKVVLIIDGNISDIKFLVKNK